MTSQHSSTRRRTRSGGSPSNGSQSGAPTERTRNRQRQAGNGATGNPPPSSNDRPAPDAVGSTDVDRTFADLGVDQEMVTALRHQGITVPRPIQAATIEAAMAGRDVCGRAPTGSGKTLAFSLPLVHMDSGDGRPVALVLAPTRELALQIAEVVTPLAKRRRLYTHVLIGGTKISKDISALRRGIDIVIGCPGRMVDLQNQGHLDLSKVTTAVLDEADRMADMGFIPDVTRLLDATKCDRGQLLLFSATLDKTTQQLEKRYQDNPVRMDVAAAPSNTSTVSHVWQVVERPNRRSAAEKILDHHKTAIVFTRTKRGADRLARQLSKGGRRAAAIHGDRTQSQRQRALAQFVDGHVGILVATDIAARGIHVDDVDVVLHFDLPATAEDYTHRSGRTGRAGADGAVVALVCNDMKADADDLRKGLDIAPKMDQHAGWVPATPKPKPPQHNRNRNGNGPRGGNQPARKGQKQRSGRRG